MKLFEAGAVAKLICFEDLNYSRIKLKNTETGIISTIHVRPENASNPALYKDNGV
jgi:hypothetical protein